MTMRRRESRAVAALVDAVAAPEPPLPPVRDTDAVASFARWLAYAPQPNGAVLRTALLALAATRISRRSRAGRLALLRRLGRSPLAEGLRATAAVSYYGDAGVLRALSHGPPRARNVPDTFLARGAAAVPETVPANEGRKNGA